MRLCENRRVPKIVDHDARRETIAAALWRVIVRVGMEGASVRAVAAEAGWSPGAMRHYFATKEELIHFGIELQLARIPARLERLAAEVAGRERAEALLRELLPLDADRMAEALVWLAALARARLDAHLREVCELAWDGEQLLARGAVCDLLGRAWPEAGEALADPVLEAEALRLHAFVDGLTTIGSSYPGRVDAAQLPALLTGYLDDLQARLTPPGSAGPAR